MGGNHTEADSGYMSGEFFLKVFAVQLKQTGPGGDELSFPEVLKKTIDEHILGFCSYKIPACYTAINQMTSESLISNSKILLIPIFKKV